MAKRRWPPGEPVRSIEEALATGATHLHLSGQGLTELPEAIGQLSQLQILILSNNRLTKLPEAIGRLTQLEVLQLDGNQLAELPDAIGRLGRLKVLTLGMNRLTELPRAILQLSQLQLLWLADNQLTELPEPIGQLSKLQILNLSSNRLFNLPSALRELDSLRDLNLLNNPALALPPEVLGLQWEDTDASTAGRMASPREILDYYFRARGARRPLNEAKLILVGYGDVGKTSLVNRLVNDRFDDAEKKTEGIKITPWSVRLYNGEDVRLHIWDFGGQEIMHSTHQFFLTQRSLYLLVLNGRGGHEDKDADYWLSLIESFGEGSPVIVVLNKVQEHPFDLNRRALQQKFGSVREFVATDCAADIGIDELRKIILRETDRLEHLRDSFPASWFGIKDRLAGMDDNYISYDEYRQICRTNGETDGEAQESLASYLHSLGIALNYKDDPRLRDTHVLNPRWVTNGIYRILNAENLAKRKGELQVDLLRQVLDPDDYPAERHGFLLELMRKFELCFTFPDDQGHYLIPDLLDKQQPEEAAEFEPDQCLNFQYHYPVLPEGLLPRFIVRTHVLSTEQPRWRTGVILDFEGSRALVKADKEDRRVVINVKGSTPRGRRELLSVIRSDFEHIHRSFAFKPEEMIPVPGAPDVLIPYKELLVMERNGIATFPKVAGDQVLQLTVKELLNGVDLARTRRAKRDEPLHPMVRVFCSYSHEDENLRAELGTHVKLLQRREVIDLWHDRRIPPGGDWKREIDEELERAAVILLLVSSDFIASDYCYDIEVKRAMARHEAGEATVVPVILRDVQWHDAPFAKCKPLPKDGKPVTRRPGRYARDSAWRNIAEGIERVVKELGPNER